MPTPWLEPESYVWGRNSPVRASRARARPAAELIAEEVGQARERLERAAKLEVQRERHALLRDMLDVLDDLDRAIESMITSDAAGLRDGILLVRDGFMAKLQARGVSISDELGAAFDPSRHEAVATVTVEESEEHDTVVDVVRPGYLVDGELLRPALVAVGQLAV